MVDTLMHKHGGPQAIHGMICEDNRAALHARDLDHARALYATLRHARRFIATHPKAAQGLEGRAAT